MSEVTAQLLSALAKAQAQAHGVEKSSTNSFHRYRYASAEDVIAVSRQALAGTGLAFVCTSATVRWEEPAVLVARYALTHEAGGTLEITSETPVIPEKGRPEDKAVATAKTYDLGYVLRGLLLLPRVEEGADVDARDDRAKEPRSKRAREEGRRVLEEARRAPAVAQAVAQVQQLDPSAQVVRVGLDVDAEVRAAGLDPRTKRAAIVRRLAAQNIGADQIEEWLGHPVAGMTADEGRELEELAAGIEAGTDDWTASLDHRLGELARKGA